jgi:nitrogen fixation protein FixH
MVIVRMLILAAAGVAALGGAACRREAAAPPAAARESPAVTLAMESPPNPPKTGLNTVTIAVTASDGSPITDADVTGEFFMPVMESMGKTTVPFTHSGNGRYTGRGNLTMAGAWQVTVTAKRGAGARATRTFNLTTRE